MKKKLISLLIAVVFAFGASAAFCACGDANNNGSENTIDGIYYRSVFNGNDDGGYVYKQEYIKLEDGKCEFVGYQGSRNFKCSYTVTNETYGWSGKRIVLSQGENYLDDDDVYIWDSGVVYKIDDAYGEAVIKNRALYETCRNATYCKEGVRPSSYGRGYFTCYADGIVSLPPAGLSMVIDGDEIKNGSKFRCHDMQLSGFVYQDVVVYGTCTVNGGVITFSSTENDFVKYGKVKSRILYLFNDIADMDVNNWTNMLYKYRAETDLDFHRPFPIQITGSEDLAEVESNKNQ